MSETQPEEPQVQTPPPPRPTPRDAEFWARRTAFLTVTQRELPADALNLNVHGRQVSGPLQGFGQFWQKTYRVQLQHVDASPSEVISAWKSNFPQFWPDGNRFFGPLTGIRPGEVGLINSEMPGGTRLSTGVLVLYADDESFTLMTPQGHVFAGWITFSAADAGDEIDLQVQVQMRGSDPAFEIGLLLFGHKQEDAFWTQTLKNIAAHFDNYPEVEIQRELLDPSWQWNRAGNIVHNAFIRSVLHDMMRPIRWAYRRIRP